MHEYEKRTIKYIGNIYVCLYIMDGEWREENVAIAK